MGQGRMRVSLASCWPDYRKVLLVQKWWSLQTEWPRWNEWSCWNCRSWVDCWMASAQAKFGHEPQGCVHELGENIQETLIVQVIQWQGCILPCSLVEQAVILNAHPRSVLPEKHCHEGFVHTSPRIIQCLGHLLSRLRHTSSMPPTKSADQWQNTHYSWIFPSAATCQAPMVGGP